MDEVEDYWERGPGATAPLMAGATTAWRSTAGTSATPCKHRQALRARSTRRTTTLLDQIVENNGERAALRVYPHWSEQTRHDAASRPPRRSARTTTTDDDCGIETLIVFLGANNALQRSPTEVAWSGDDFRDLAQKNKYTVWRPAHFAAELAEVERPSSASKPGT